MPDIEELVRRSIEGDADAWRALQTTLQPTVLAIARGHQQLRSKGLAGLPDDLSEIVTATFERLSRSDYHNLKSFVAKQTQAASPAGLAGQARTTSFDSWLYGAVDFAIREHLRQRFGKKPELSSDVAARVQPSKRDLQSQAGRFEDIEFERAFLHTVGMTAKLTVAQIYAHIEREFGVHEARAMHLYYAQDRDFAQIASELGLSDEREAAKMIRRLNARLRYRFLDEGDGEPDA
jgi:hypothetical protein